MTIPVSYLIDHHLNQFGSASIESRTTDVQSKKIFTSGSTSIEIADDHRLKLPGRLVVGYKHTPTYEPDISLNQYAVRNDPSSKPASLRFRTGPNGYFDMVLTMIYSDKTKSLPIVSKVSPLLVSNSAVKHVAHLEQGAHAVVGYSVIAKDAAAAHLLLDPLLDQLFDLRFKFPR